MFGSVSLILRMSSMRKQGLRTSTGAQGGSQQHLYSLFPNIMQEGQMLLLQVPQGEQVVPGLSSTACQSARAWSCW